MRQLTIPLPPFAAMRNTRRVPLDARWIMFYLNAIWEASRILYDHNIFDFKRFCFRLKLKWMQNAVQHFIERRTAVRKFILKKAPNTRRNPFIFPSESHCSEARTTDVRWWFFHYRIRRMHHNNCERVRCKSSVGRWVGLNFNWMITKTRNLINQFSTNWKLQRILRPWNEVIQLQLSG